MSEFGIRLVAILGVISILGVIISLAMIFIGCNTHNDVLTAIFVILVIIIGLAWVVFGCLMILECAFEWHWLLP